MKFVDMSRNGISNRQIDLSFMACKKELTAEGAEVFAEDAEEDSPLFLCAILRDFCG